MKIPMTEYLDIDIESERWVCRVCSTDLASARGGYKEGLLVYARDPREIHRHRLDPALYSYTHAPDPRWCAILEYYCPGCATLVEAEYTVPGHPPINDLEFDIDDLKRRWEGKTHPGFRRERDHSSRTGRGRENGSRR